MRVGIIADSASNLPADRTERHDITIVPMILKFGDRIVRDGVDLPQSEFYRALVEENVAVSTSAPSVGDFTEAFEQVLARADAAVCVTVASFVSAAHDAAVQAARSFGDRVRVVDSKSASLGEGLAVIEAARAAESGATLEGVVARVEDVRARTSFVATIDTFEFLRKSGRVNVVLAYAATTLNIKPVFAFRAGKLEQLGRARSRERALQRVVEEVKKAGESGPLHIGVAHADRAEEAQALLRTLEGEVEVIESCVSEFTPLMGAHTGPGVIGVAFWS